MMADHHDTSPLTDPGGGGMQMFNLDLNSGHNQKVSAYLSDAVFADLISSNREPYSTDPLSSALTDGQFDSYSAASQYIAIQPLTTSSGQSSAIGDNGFSRTDFKSHGLLYNIHQENAYSSPGLINSVGSLMENYHKNGEKIPPTNHSNTSRSAPTDPSFVNMLNTNDLTGIKKEKTDFYDGNNVRQDLGQNSRSLNFDALYQSNGNSSGWNSYFPNTNVSSTTDTFMPMQHPQSFPLGFNSSPQPYLSQAPGSVSPHISTSVPSFQSDWGLPVGFSPPLLNSQNKRSPDAVAKNQKSKKQRRKSPAENGARLTSKSPHNFKQEVFPNKEHSITVDKNILNSTARDQLVNLLMNNLRTTVQFESFCLSIPRNKKKEMAFHQKVLATSNLIFNVAESAVVSQPFPEKFIKSAKMVVTMFCKALALSAISIEDADIETDFSEQVEEQIPFSMLWVIRYNQAFLTANWEGQFVATVNPINCTLCISIFQFQPQFSPDGEKCLEQVRLTQKLAEDITCNMEQFEVSRQLRADFKLKDIIRLYLHSPYGEENEGVLVIEVNEPPQYWQRWLHTSAENMNHWQKRSNFFSLDQPGTPLILYVGGLVSELNEVVALMLASEERLQTVFKEGSEIPFSTSANACQSSSMCESRKEPEKKAELNLTELCEGIKNVLVQNMLITAHDCKDFSVCKHTHDQLVDDRKVHTSTRSRTQRFDGLKAELPSCLRDYIQYKCKDSDTLQTMLSSAMRARSHGFSEADFHTDRCWDLDIDTMTVADLIRRDCSNQVYYSFCKGEFGQVGHEQHCEKCHSCNFWRYWHCSRCDQCTNGKVCHRCGSIQGAPDKTIIKPLSVFKKQLTSGSLQLDDVKSSWLESLSQPDSDVLHWTSTATTEQITGETTLPVYNVSTAMVDQLGLLNPVGFLLGQPGVQGATRKHRRNKRTDGPVMSLDESSKSPAPGQGCVLQ